MNMPIIRSAITGLAFAFGLNAALAAETITYGSLPDPGYDAVVWAIENGKVSDPNVTIKVERVSSIPALMQAAMTQQFNLMPNGVLSLPQMRESGLPIKVLSTLLRYHPEGHSADVWVMPNSPYKTIQDLKGKTIAVVSGEAQNVISVRWVISEHFGMNADLVGGDFRWVEMPQAQFEARRVASTRYRSATCHPMPRRKTVSTARFSMAPRNSRRCMAVRCRRSFSSVTMAT